MALVKWQQDMSVGDEKTDVEHQKLIELVNNLHDAMRSGEGASRLGATFTELVHYTRTHFTNEEALQEKIGYPHIAEHRAEHASLTQQAMELLNRFDSGEKAVLTIDLMQFLARWVTHHIRESDLRFAPYVKAARSDRQ